MRKLACDKCCFGLPLTAPVLIVGALGGAVSSEHSQCWPDLMFQLCLKSIGCFDVLCRCGPRDWIIAPDSKHVLTIRTVI